MTVPCTICGADAPVPVRTLRDHVSTEAFTLARCAGCGGLYISDPPAPEAIGRYYETAAGDEMHTRPGPLFARLRDVRLRRDTAPLLKRLPAGSRVADLGAGDGSLTRVVRAAGYRSAGVDLYDPADWAHADIPYRQTNLAGGTLAQDDLTVDGAPADAIVMRHVLEHLHHPRESLETARRLGVGRVLVIVPNAASLFARALGEGWYYWDPPRHLTFFTAASLRDIAARAGYTVPVLQTYGLDEVVTSAHRSLMLRGGRPAGLTAATRPTGPLAGAASIVSAPVLRSVLRAVLEAPDARPAGG